MAYTYAREYTRRRLITEKIVDKIGKLNNKLSVKWKKFIIK
jgi:hypothetical protein